MAGLLLSSFMVIIGGMSHVEAQENSSSEVGAASGSNRFVIWSDETFGSRDILFRRSTDNGATWKAVVNLSNNPGVSSDPQIAVSGSNVYVIWTQLNSNGQSPSITFRTSTDNGVSWGSKVKVANLSCSNCPMHLAVSGANVYLSFTSGNPAGDIYFKRSSDSGTTWMPEFNLSSNPGKSFDPRMAISGSNIYVIWTQGNSEGTSYDIFFRRSTDSGSTWKSKINLSNDPGNSGNARIVASASSVHVVWEGVTGVLDIFYKRSTSSGSSWESVRNISEGKGGLYSTDPQIAISGTKVYVAWITASGEQFFRRSTDGGITWKDAVMVASGGQGRGGIAQNMVVAGSNVFLTWASGEERPVLFRRSSDSGASWSAAKDVIPPGRSHGHVLAVSGSTVFIASAERLDTSSDDFGKGQDILLVRSTNSGGTWSSPINLSKNSEQSANPQIAA